MDVTVSQRAINLTCAITVSHKLWDNKKIILAVDLITANSREQSQTYLFIEFVIAPQRPIQIYLISFI